MLILFSVFPLLLRVPSSVGVMLNEIQDKIILTLLSVVVPSEVPLVENVRLQDKQCSPLLTFGFNRIYSTNLISQLVTCSFSTHTCSKK